MTTVFRIHLLLPVAAFMLAPAAIAQNAQIPVAIPAQNNAGFKTGPVMPVGLSVPARLINNPLVRAGSGDKQIRINIRFVMLDPETRRGMYARLGAKRLKTVGSQVPRLQAIPEADFSETRGTQMIAKSSRVTTCILEDAELAEIMRDVAGSAGSNITRAPSIVLIDGQETEMTDLVQRPFLVDLQRQETDQGVDVNSVVQVLNEGMTTHLAAATTPSGRIHLVSRLMFEKIVSVEGEEVFGVRDEPVTIQDPVHQRKIVHATENLEAGQTLLVDPYVKHETKISTTTGVPILSSIPYLAKSFTNTTRASVEQQMIVLIQPFVEAEVESNIER